MIDELRIYRLVPGGLADYLRLAEEVAVPVRGDRFGTLLGFWHGEVGAVNSVFNLWQHTDLNGRQALREQLEQLESWRSDYLPHVRPLMQQQEIRLMTQVLPLRPPIGVGHVYEFRIVRTRPGHAQAVAEALANGPDATFLDQTVALWTTFAGRLNEVVHLSAWSDARSRLAASLQSPAWQALLRKTGPLIDEIESSLTLPARHSPWQ